MERLGVVLRRRPVGRPDLEERRAAAREDRRHAEVPADRDELSPRDGDGAAVRERVEGEKESGGRVRHGEGVDVGEERGEEGEEKRADVLASPPAPARREVELERRVARCAEDGLARRGGERSPTQVRVEEDARGVDDGARSGGRAERERGPGGLEERFGRVRAGGQDPAPEAFRGLAKSVPRPEPPVPGGERAPLVAREESLDGRRDAEGARQSPYNLAHRWASRSSGSSTRWIAASRP